MNLNTSTVCFFETALGFNPEIVGVMFFWNSPETCKKSKLLGGPY